MKRQIVTCLSVAVVALLLYGETSAHAAIPRQINFQGRLADVAGTPLTGSYSITFRIFNASAGGAACHSAAATVAANSGLFNANIGPISSACDFSVPYWLELQVGTDEPMSPRISLTASAYAIRAEMANNSQALRGYTPGNASGQVPLNNNARSVGLNADLLDGQNSTSFAAAGHTHPFNTRTMVGAPCPTYLDNGPLCSVNHTGTFTGNYVWQEMQGPGGVWKPSSGCIRELVKCTIIDTGY